MLRNPGLGALAEGFTAIAGGTDKQVQFNDAGVINGSAGLTFTKGNAGSTAQFSIGSGSAGSVSAPALIFGTDTAGGWYRVGNSQWGFAAGGSDVLRMLASNINLVSGTQLAWMSSTDYSGSIDTILTRGGAAATLQHGAADVDTNAAIVAQTLRTQGALAGGTADQAGKDFTILVSPGKGTGAGGKLLIQLAKAGNTGTVVNTANTLITLDSVSSYALFAAGTALAAPLKFTSGPVLSTAAAGAIEFDGVQFYNTIEANNRAAIPAQQYFHLTGDGGPITTIGNFFGATSNITLVSGAYYIIDIHMFYLKTTLGPVTWTLTNPANPTNMNIYYEMSPTSGTVAPPGTAGTMLAGQFSKVTSGTLAFTTGTLGTAVDHYARFQIFLDNSTGVSLKIQATSTSGSITPRQGSYWIARRVTSGSVGTFVA